MKINDLINFKPINTVIKLASDIKREEKKSLFDSFILTPDIEKSLRIILSSFKEENGKGFFLKGNFGTGKSHFLAFLDFFFTEKNDRDHVFEQSDKLNEYRQKLEKLNILTVPISLLDYKSDISLEDIIFNNIEKKLYQFNIKETLLPENIFIESFEKYFLKDLIEYAGDQYNNLESNDKTEKIKKFISEKKDFPFIFKYDRKIFTQKLFEILANNNFDHLFILIDELSEFLKSKPDSENLHEDVRFLQFLGELTTEKPLYIIGSMQESIDEITEINSYIMKRISDRYKIRLQLSAIHSKQVILERLLKKNDKAKLKIKEVYLGIKKEFPRYEVSEDVFISTYPIDNNVFDLLDAVVTLFSKTRGALDFIYRTLEKHIDNDVSYLVSPEYIFDHFKNNIQENPETNDFIDVVWNYFDKKIPELFDKNDSIELAYKIIKLLILIRICRFKNYFTLKELAHFLRFKITEIQGDYNYEFLSENILAELCAHSDYIIKEQQDNFLEDRYKIELELNLNTLFENKKNEIIKRLRGKEKNILWDAFSWYNSNFLPIDILKDSIQSGINYTINWFNSKRKIRVWLKDFNKLDKEFFNSNKQIIKSDNLELIFVIGFPIDVEIKKAQIIEELKNLDQDFANNFIFIIPDEITPNELKIFLEASAIKKIVKELEDNQNKDINKMKILACSHLEDIMIKIKSIFERVYLPLNFFHISKNSHFEDEKKSILYFEKELEKASSVILSKKYPDFPYFAPKVEYITKGDLASLTKNFIAKGEVSIKEAEFIGLSTRIEGILFPLKLVKKKGGVYILYISIEESKILQDFFVYLEQGISAPYALFLKLSSSSLGLMKEQFVMIFFSLVYSGYIQALKNGNKFPIDKLSIENIFDLHEIKEGEIINDIVWNFLTNLDIFKKNLFKGKNIIAQKELWDELTSFKAKNISKLETIKQADENHKGYNIYKEIEKSSISSILKAVDILLNSIKVSYSPKEGLEYFHKSIFKIDNLNNIIEKFDKIFNFYYLNMPGYVRVYAYLHNDFLITNIHDYQYLHDFYINLKEDSENIDKILFEDSIKRLEQDFNTFQEEYSEKYKTFHQKIYNTNELKDIKKVLNTDNAKILSDLSEIEFASVENNYNKIKENLDKFENDFCKEDSLIYLKLKNRCNCGLALGEEKNICKNLKDDLPNAIDKGIREYIKYLQKPEVKEKIEAYIYSIQDEKNVENIENIKKIISPNDAPLIFYTSILTSDVIFHLKNALYKKNIKIKPLDLNVLVKRFNGMKLDRNKIFQIIDEFLDEKNDDVFYSFEKIDEKTSKSQYPREKESLIKEKFINIESFIENSLSKSIDKVLFILKNSQSINLLRLEAFRTLIEKNQNIDDVKALFKNENIILTINNQDFALKLDDDIYSAVFAFAFLITYSNIIEKKIICAGNEININPEKISSEVAVEYINFNFFIDFINSIIVDFLNRHQDFYSYPIYKIIDEINSFNEYGFNILNNFIKKENSFSNNNFFWNNFLKKESLSNKLLNIKEANHYFKEFLNDIDVILVIDCLSIDIFYLLQKNILSNFEIIDNFFIINKEKTDTSYFRKEFFGIN